MNVGEFDSIEKDANGKSVRKTNEVDFYAIKGNRRMYVQVTADLTDSKIKESSSNFIILIYDAA